MRAHEQITEYQNKSSDDESIVTVSVCQRVKEKKARIKNQQSYILLSATIKNK